LNNNAVLPLQFLSFTAQKCGNHVCLNWKTANEQNVSHFEIQRSTDGRNFITIKTEAAKNQPLNLYSYEDDWAGLRAADKIYYRIRQVDGDGKINYSAIAFVKQNATLAEVYPTLFSKSFTIQNNSTDNLQLIMYSSDGKILKNRQYTKA
jgi:predicted phage tail protein